MKYVLYCAQEANFQTRSMLIPYDLIMASKRKEDLEILRKHASSKTFTIDDEEYVVDNLVIQDYTWDGRSGSQVPHEYTKIVNDLTRYADGLEEECLREQDIKWYDSSITNLTGGFNNVKNYCRLRQLNSYKDKQIEIVEGFLVLETDNGKLKFSSVDTVEEMYMKYYSSK
jgi:hypothetical protein